MLTLWLGGADEVRRRVERVGALSIHRCGTMALAAKLARAGLVGAIVVVVPRYARGAKSAQDLATLRRLAPGVEPMLLAERFDYDEGVAACEDGALAVLELASTPAKLARMIRGAVEIHRREAAISEPSSWVDDRAVEAVARLA